MQRPTRLAFELRSANMGTSDARRQARPTHNPGRSSRCVGTARRHGASDGAVGVRPNATGPLVVRLLGKHRSNVLGRAPGSQVSPVASASRRATPSYSHS